jgi:hypothetical protein
VVEEEEAVAAGTDIGVLWCRVDAGVFVEADGAFIPTATLLPIFPRLTTTPLRCVDTGGADLACCSACCCCTAEAAANVVEALTDSVSKRPSGMAGANKPVPPPDCCCDCCGGGGRNAESVSAPAGKAEE